LSLSESVPQTSSLDGPLTRLRKDEATEESACSRWGYLVMQVLDAWGDEDGLEADGASSSAAGSHGNGRHNHASTASANDLSQASATLGVRPRGAAVKASSEEKARLTPLAEEDISEVEHSLDDRRSHSGTSGRRMREGGKSPSGASGSLENSRSMDNSRSNLEVSQLSCNELSVGVDYSVEDSLELEKCDFVEAVSPELLACATEAGALPGRIAEVSGPGVLNISSPTVQQGGGQPAAAPGALAVRQRLDSMNNPVSRNRARNTSPRCNPSSPGRREEEDYGDDSFEENASVMEEIDEESMGGGSCGSAQWGDGEDV